VVSAASHFESETECFHHQARIGQGKKLWGGNNSKKAKNRSLVNSLTDYLLRLISHNSLAVIDQTLQQCLPLFAIVAFKRMEGGELWTAGAPTST
jgi:hypothetical protein